MNKNRNKNNLQPGDQKGRRTILAIGRELGTKKYDSEALVYCSCGKIKYTELKNFERYLSCGCLRNEQKSKILFNYSHGLYNHPLYRVWISIKSRCYRETSPYFHIYGGRGIKVCDEWISNPKLFIDTYKDVYKKGLQIDRIDPDGDYCPSNVRFVTPKENSNNKRKDNHHMVVYNGKEMNLTQAWELTGKKLHMTAITYRLKHGWKVEDAFNIPPRPGKKWVKNG